MNHQSSRGLESTATNLPPDHPNYIRLHGNASTATWFLAPRINNTSSLMPEEQGSEVAWPSRVNNMHRFDELRLSSLNGYDQIPSILSGLEMQLPKIVLYTGRIVEAGDRAWELWSPNSVWHPFYPGYPSMEFRLEPAFLPQWWWCDGHLGRFDYTVSPQLLGYLWWTLIMHRLPK